MKFYFLLTVASIPCLLTGYAQDSASSKLRELDWLLGTWKMEKKNGTLTENWEQTSDTSFNESSYLQNLSGEKKLLENVQIIFDQNAFYYVPTVADQNNRQPVRFKITAYSKRHFIAENPEHDFPKRIIYEVMDGDSLHARIDAGAEMPEKKSDFYYSRQKK